MAIVRDLGRFFHAAAAMACCLAAGAGAEAAPIALQTPAGLAPGSVFRFLYTTQTTTAASSTDITTYDTFVNADAAGATYGGVAVQWKTLGSTATVDARDHVGGFGTIVPVYNTLGQLLATDLTDSTSQGLWADIAPTPPIVGLDGSTVVTDEYVWTGTESDGTVNLNNLARALGGASPYVGNASGGTYSWLNRTSYSNTELRSLYAMSETLTVASSSVPEIDPAGLSSVVTLLGGVLALVERRRRT